HRFALQAVLLLDWLLVGALLVPVLRIRSLLPHASAPVPALTFGVCLLCLAAFSVAVVFSSRREGTVPGGYSALRILVFCALGSFTVLFFSRSVGTGVSRLVLLLFATAAAVAISTIHAACGYLWARSSPLPLIGVGREDLLVLVKEDLGARSGCVMRAAFSDRIATGASLDEYL